MHSMYNLVHYFLSLARLYYSTTILHYEHIKNIYKYCAEYIELGHTLLIILQSCIFNISSPKRVSWCVPFSNKRNTWRHFLARTWDQYKLSKLQSFLRFKDIPLVL